MKKDPGSISQDEPLAYFLTWTTYGTWLPGDERGSFKKPGDYQAPDPARAAAARRLMTEPALTLDVAQRALVERTIADHCRIRGWHLHAVNCRTRHVHAVVTAPGGSPNVVMDQFKAWSSRRLKERERAGGVNGKPVRQNWWTQRGSKRWLNDEASLADAIQYVMELQGRPTPDLPDEPDAKTQA